MSLQAYLFRHGAGKSDRRRNASTTFPEGITFHADIRYGKAGKYNLLNVYYPQGTREPLPTIVSIHGGGYVYGTKEVYHFYCADLARRGFAVVNFNYRLAPRYKFPAPLEDTNQVMEWLVANAETYHVDPDRLFIVGDSAGAQLASQYAAIAANPEYAGHFDFTVPAIRIRALGLNCGMYDMKPRETAQKRRHSDYLGRHISSDDPRLDVLSAIGSNYPPSFLLTSANDFLRDAAEPMSRFLADKGVDTVYKCYGTPEQTHIGHVFHVDIRYPEAAVANDEQCDFFRKYL